MYLFAGFPSVWPIRTLNLVLGAPRGVATVRGWDTSPS